jgi:hypothetical protein
MKVKELIQALQDEDPEAETVVTGVQVLQGRTVQVTVFDSLKVEGKNGDLGGVVVIEAEQDNPESA